MATVIDIKNPVDVRRIGMQALNDALGCEGTQVFMNQHFNGVGDWTQERHELPDRSFKEFRTELGRIDAEMRSAGRYNV